MNCNLSNCIARWTVLTSLFRSDLRKGTFLGRLFMFFFFFCKILNCAIWTCTHHSYVAPLSCHQFVKFLVSFSIQDDSKHEFKKFWELLCTAKCTKHEFLNVVVEKIMTEIRIEMFFFTSTMLQQSCALIS